MPTQIEVRYRCHACWCVVKMGHLDYAAMANAAVTAFLQGESNFEGGDYVAFVCAACQENPEETQTLLLAAE